MKKNILLHVSALLLFGPLCITSFSAETSEPSTESVPEVVIPDITVVPTTEATPTAMTPVNVLTLQQGTSAPTASETTVETSAPTEPTEMPAEEAALVEVSVPTTDTDVMATAVTETTADQMPKEQSPRVKTLNAIIRESEGSSTLPAAEQMPTSNTPMTDASTSAKVDQAVAEAAAIATDEAQEQIALDNAQADLQAAATDIQQAAQEESKYSWKNSVYLKWLVPLLIVLFLLYLAYATSSGNNDEDERRNNDSACRPDGSCR